MIDFTDWTDEELEAYAEDLRFETLRDEQWEGEF